MRQLTVGCCTLKRVTVSPSWESEAPPTRLTSPWDITSQNAGPCCAARAHSPSKLYFFMTSGAYYVCLIWMTSLVLGIRVPGGASSGRENTLFIYVHALSLKSGTKCTHRYATNSGKVSDTYPIAPRDDVSHAGKPITSPKLLVLCVHAFCMVIRASGSVCVCKNI